MSVIRRVIAVSTLLLVGCAPVSPVPPPPPTSDGVATLPTASAATATPAPAAVELEPLVLTKHSSGHLKYPWVASGPYADSVNRVIREQVDQIHSFLIKGDWFDQYGSKVLMNESGVLSFALQATLNYNYAAHPTNYDFLVSIDVRSGQVIKLGERTIVDRAFVNAVRTAGRAEFAKLDLLDAFAADYSDLDILEYSLAADQWAADGAPPLMGTAVVPGGIMLAFPGLRHATGDYHELVLKAEHLTAPSVGAPRYGVRAVSELVPSAAGNVRFAFAEPVVSGVSDEVDAAVHRAVAEARESATAEVAKLNYDCPDVETPIGSAVGGIYQQRYLSVLLAWRFHGCDDSTHAMSRAINLDLHTGQPVTLPLFVRAEGDALGLAAGIELRDAQSFRTACWRNCSKSDARDQIDPPDLATWRQPPCWMVSEVGITVLYDPQDDPVLVPWEAIVPAGVEVPAQTTQFVSAGATFSLVQVGPLVTVTSPAGDRWEGIRRAGARTAKLFRVSNRGGRQAVHEPGYSLTFATGGGSEVTAAHLR